MPDARKIAEAIESIDFFENAIDKLVGEFSNVTFPEVLVLNLSVRASQIDGGNVLGHMELVGNDGSLNGRIHRAMLDAAVQEMDSIRKELLLEIENA